MCPANSAAELRENARKAPVFAGIFRVLCNELVARSFDALARADGLVKHLSKLKDMGADEPDFEYPIYRQVPITPLCGNPPSFTLGSAKLIHGKARSLSILQFNNQLLWLLVGAYESYETFLKKTYAYFGFFAPQTWPGHHLGDSSMAQAAEQWPAWYKHRIKQMGSRLQPKDILKVFRETLTGYSECEAVTRCDLPAKFWVGWIERIRHNIVHVGDTIQDEIHENILTRLTGYAAGSEPYERVDGTIRSAFLKRWQSTDYFWLTNEDAIKREFAPDIPPRLDALISRLAEHALLTYEKVVEYFEEDPWTEITCQESTGTS